MIFLPHLCSFQLYALFNYGSFSVTRSGLSSSKRGGDTRGLGIRLLQVTFKENITALTATKGRLPLYLGERLGCCQEQLADNGCKYIC